MLGYLWLECLLSELLLEVFQLVESGLECFYLLFLLTDDHLYTLRATVQLETEPEVSATGALHLVQVVEETLDVLLLSLTGESDQQEE